MREARWVWRWRRGGAGAPLRHLTLSPQAPGLSPSEEDAGLGPAASRMRRRARLEIPESAFPADLGRRGGAPAAALRRGAGGGEPGFARAAGTPAAPRARWGAAAWNAPSEALPGAVAFWVNPNCSGF